MKLTTSFEDVVANRGEDLRFPISSSSGFSSPFAFNPIGYRRTLQISAGLFYYTAIN
jgi:hypothetical protein